MKMLGGLSAQAFLSRYWQKTPYLIRGAFQDGLDSVDGDDLAGLATEAEVESRLVSSGNWQLRHGPFFEDDFAALPERDWTLLVQAVDHWIPEVAQLFDHFRFIPAWRLDDVMLSYSAPGGGVGPHFDHYDVFLLQLSGEREWRIGQSCSEADDCRDDTELKILVDFVEQERWVLGPGDMLYVPPGVAHWGTAVSPGITCSIGFRAPSRAESLVSFAHFLAEQDSEFERYADPDLLARDDPFRITGEDVDRVQALLAALADNRDAIADWFGRYMTEPKYGETAPDEPALSPREIAERLERQPLLRNRAARLAYTAGTLFVEGHALSTRLPAEGLRWLCESERIEPGDLGGADEVQRLGLLAELVNRDAYYFDED